MMIRPIMLTFLLSLVDEQNSRCRDVYSCCTGLHYNGKLTHCVSLPAEDAVVRKIC